MSHARRPWVAATLTVALWGGASACGALDGYGQPVVTRESARLLGTVSREPPADDTAAAHEALRQDAWRREHRFLDAVDPGHLFRSTRVRQVEIDTGLWTSDELYQLGGQLFSLHFSPSVGLGAGDMPPLRRFHQGRRGGPDATRCASCHWRGGLAGAGGAADNAMLRGDGQTESNATARNPPSLAGAGLRALLAQEMTDELQAQRDTAIEFAIGRSETVRVAMEAKGISFGFITVDPRGDVERRELTGVDLDLVIKPFGWKGTIASIRDASEDALQIHHGMQSETLVIEGDASRVGPFGGDDPDGDGVIEEIIEGQVTALTLFIAMQGVPQERPPEDDAYLLTLWAQGRQDFDELGCASCHVPELPLDDPVFSLRHRYGGPRFTVNLTTDGATPRLGERAEDDAHVVRLFSDLRRHHMGPALAEARSERGVPADAFLTPPLWGLARSRPYLHDGRASTIEEAILLHGGEAEPSREAFERLDEIERAPLRVFLTSLTRARHLVTP